METIAFILSISGLLSMVIASLLKGKDMRLILIFVFLCNALLAASYLVDGSGLNGAASCFLGAAQTLINYFFDKKNKPLPKWLIAVYAMSFIVLNLVVGGFNLLGLLAIAASLTFIMFIGQKEGAKYRVWVLINESLWVVYDIFSQSYGALFTHGTLVVTALVGMFIHDRKKAD